MNRATSATGWVRNPDGSQGYTWNPITGCRNHVNGICKGGGFPCYAYRLAHGRLRESYLANGNIARSGYPIPKRLDELPSDEDDPFYPRFWPERLEEIPELPDLRDYSPIVRNALWHRKRRGIFVCDMSDLFGIGVPEQWIKCILSYIKSSPDHRFYLLTKQPQNLLQWSPFPDNCWVGVTVANQEQATRCLVDFAKVEASVKYLSLEPLLSRVDIMPYLPGWVSAGTTFENPMGVERYDIDSSLVNSVDWLIIGALTGTLEDLQDYLYKTYPTPPRPVQLMQLQGKRWSLQPNRNWVREIVEAADKARIPVFLKDNLMPILPDLDLSDESMLIKLTHELRKVTQSLAARVSFVEKSSLSASSQQKDDGKND